jgi:hypothetical protein
MLVQRRLERPDVVADRDTAICVDKDGKRVDDSQCGQQTVIHHSGGIGVGTAFLWYYLGRNSAVPYYGESIRGPRLCRPWRVRAARRGQAMPDAPAASRMTRSAAVSRGGLGSQRPQLRRRQVLIAWSGMRSRRATTGRQRSRRRA